MTPIHEPVSGYFVWTKKGKAPRFHHPNLQSAVAEAERLARLNPGAKFHVMAAVLKISAQYPEPAREGAVGEASAASAAPGFPAANAVPAEVEDAA